MKGCFGCHAMTGAAQGAAKSECHTCHLTDPGGQMKLLFSTGELKPPRWLGNAQHTADFIERHKRVAADNSALCASCHTERYCTDCHDGRVRPRTVHPNDWISMHPIAARQNNPRCTSCHQEQSFCLECHQRIGVAMSGPNAALARFHPPGFGALGGRGPGHHAWEAQRNLNACVSCHTERDCAICHAATGRGGLAVDPHPPSFRATCATQLRRNGRPCLVCHEPESAELESVAELLRIGLPSGLRGWQADGRRPVKNSANSLHRGSAEGYRSATSLCRAPKEDFSEGTGPVLNRQYVLGFSGGYLTGAGAGFSAGRRESRGTPASVQDHRGKGDRRPPDHPRGLLEGAHFERRVGHGRSRAAANVRRELIFVAALGALGGSLGCDQGAPAALETTGPPPHVVWTYPANEATDVPLTFTVRAQFDRFLMPSTAGRPAMCLQPATVGAESPGTEYCIAAGFAPQYDPVDRVATWIIRGEIMPLTRYNVRLFAPSAPGSPNGVRAFDGAPLEKEFTFAFTTGRRTAHIDARTHGFCDVRPPLCPLPEGPCDEPAPVAMNASVHDFLASSCASGGNCHGGGGAQGPSGSVLRLDDDGAGGGLAAVVRHLVDNAVVASETATGPDPVQPSRNVLAPFGRNMPYIDATNPANSYLVTR